jgi:hypothetical protein
MNTSEKLRRKALRPAAAPKTAPKPASQGAAYRVAHACFDCRKSFKMAPRTRQPTCPNCGGAAHWMGRSFKAPPASDREQWRKVQALYDAGFRFFSYRSKECAPFPERFADVKTFIRDNPNHPYRVGEA